MQVVLARAYRSVFVAVALALPAISSAAEINWNVVTGDYNTPANWLGGVLPGAEDAASINNGGTATISASPASPVFELWVGSNSNQANGSVGVHGTLNQTAGTVEVIGWTVIGRTFPGTAGPITQASTYNISGGVLNTDQIEMGQSFGAGVSPALGNLNVSGDAIVNARNYIYAGHGDFGSFGGVANIVVKDNAQLNITATGGNVQFFALGYNGFNTGNKGNLTIQNNAKVQIKVPLRVGWVEEGRGSVTMSGNTLLDIDSGEDSPAAFMLGDFNNGLNNSPENRPIGEFTMSGGVVNVGNADRRPSWSAVGGSGKGTLNISGGTFNAWILNGLNVADTDQNGFAGEGVVNLSGTGALNATELWFGKIGRATGTMNQTGGSVTVGLGAFVDRVATGAGGGVATAPTDSALVLGGLDLGAAGTQAQATGTYNLSAGTVSAAKIIIGDAATGVWNQTGGSVTVAESLTIARIINSYGVPSVGTLNLNGGTITTPAVTGGAGSSTLNLNGGVLRASANSTAFITGVTNVVAGAGGAKIDTNTFNVTVAQQITGSGSVTKQGAGTLSLTAAIAHTGGTNVDGGSIRVSGAAQTSILSAAGDVDLRNGKLVLDYTGGSSPEAQVVTILTAGYNLANKFSSGKLKNTTASNAEGLGWVTDTANSTVTVGSALYGDADLSGGVNFDDLLKLAQNYGATNTGTWARGDFTYDKAINFDDLLRLAQNYGGSLASAGDAVMELGASEAFAHDFARALAVVPEPATMLSLVALAPAARRRRA